MISALLAFITARPRLVAALVVAAVALAFIGSVYLHGDRSGAQRVRDANVRQDQRAQGESLGTWHEVEHCIDAGGRWDHPAGQCDMGNAP